jgi:C-terminal processing protease CtpA/Prc
MRAVWLFTLADRGCDPFLFEKGDDNKWRIDLKTAGLGLGHTYGNIWYVHYDRLEESGFWKYQFGFRDFYFYRPKGEQFDHQGIPYYHRWGMQIGYVREGSLITQIVKGSYTEKIGLREGDMILSWEGRTAPSPSYLGWRMDRVREGLDVEIVYRRGKTIHHTIVEAPPRPEAGKLRWGMTVSREGPKNYPVVNYVTPGSQSDEMGLKKGDYILAWQDKQPASIGDINNSIKLAKAGDIVTATVRRAGNSTALSHNARARRKMAEVR